MKASRAESTIKKYNDALAAWEVWCRLRHVSTVKPTHEDIARYMIDLFNEQSPYSRIETAFFAINWKLNTSVQSCLNNPCDTKFLHLLLEGLKRLLANPVNRKEPITAEMLYSVVMKFGDTDLKGIRTCAMMLVAYAAFLRYDELSNLKICDLEFAESHVKIFIEKSKTDQFREGAWVIVGATGKVTCPVRMLSKYVQYAEITNQDSSEFLFRPIALHKSNGQYKLRSGKMTYTRTREIVKDALKSIGLDSSKFGLHSLRAGGASAAAAIGVPDRLFKRHGRWKSDSSKDRYVKESFENKKLVSMNLGI